MKDREPLLEFDVQPVRGEPGRARKSLRARSPHPAGEPSDGVEPFDETRQEPRRDVTPPTRLWCQPEVASVDFEP